MNSSDKKDFAQTMQLAAIAYDRELDQPVLRAYFEFLEDYSIEQIKVAVKAHCVGTGVESKFFPKVADITAQINGSKKQSEQADQFNAEAAWLSIPKAIRGVGQYGSPQFHDLVTTACVSIMGWKNLCSMTEKDVVWKMKEFVELYQNLKNKPLDQLPNNIQGLESIQEMKGGMKTILTTLENLKVEK
jgi:hypothetical protein